MDKKRYFQRVIFSILVLLLAENVFSCSMYKLSIGDKTMVGCNHDTWFLTPRIWFETAGYGATFTGARFDGPNGYAPQSGMNEYGLAFSRLAAATPENVINPSGKKPINNPTLFLKEVLHQCKTVDEVQNYIDQYDHSVFIQDVFIYIDKSGKYLIVEPFSTSMGNDSKYVLANFCPSQVSDFSKITQARYRNGTTFLKNKIDTSLDFCTALSDTMHVCREKIGDGTLLTSIWNLHDGLLNLYFYHDYKHTMQFILKDELAKGDHILDVATLFPPNAEFKKLADFKTPLNSNAIDLFLRWSFVFFFASAIYFLISYFRRSTAKKYFRLKLALFPLSLMMMYYVFVLATEINIYYFPAPYKHYKFSMMNIAAYIPFLLLLLIVPLLWINFKIFKEKVWLRFSKWLFTLNNVVYLALLILFAYWGLYNIF